MALNINGTTGISGVDGSASAPALTGTDSNTGINFGSDILAFNVGGSEKARFHSNGNFGVNSTNPQTKFVVQDSDGGTGIEFSMGASESYIQCYSRSASDYKDLSLAAEQIKFRTNDNSERMRLSSGGSLLIGRTTATAYGSLLQIKSIDVVTDGDTTGMTFDRTDAFQAWVAMRFRTYGSQRGYIQVNTDSTTYSTSSDYRLKENVVSISDGITRLKQLKPYRFNFKENPNKTLRDGFFAHEASEVVPEAVVGTKDAVDDKGNIDPQGIDQSKLVPLLTAALQEAVAKIEVLETKVAALEAG